MLDDRSVLSSLAVISRTRSTSLISAHTRNFARHSELVPHFKDDGSNVTRFILLTAAIYATLPSPAAAQDIRGIEICTAEKQMERRTSCLQSNVEFLQQALNKLTRDTEQKMAAADRDLAAARAEIAALKSTVDKLTRDLAKAKGNAAERKR
jgi:septal ring factor EnvC (AmiA/AmiB activator)